MQPGSTYIGETAKKLGTRLNEHRKSVRACNPTISSLVWRCYGQCTRYWSGKPPALTQDMSKFARSSEKETAVFPKITKIQVVKEVGGRPAKTSISPKIAQNLRNRSFC